MPPKVKGPDGREYRTREADFDVLKAGHQVLELDDGTRVRFQPVIRRVLVVMDDDGSVKCDNNGQPIVLIESRNDVSAELTGNASQAVPRK